ncbi:zinc ribbon domain-containing protein [bacterium]|nr:zinc ribbon domain-containing protein [bacterium]
MPTYSYRCPECDHRFNLFHSISDSAPKQCPECGTEVERQMGTGTAINFGSKSIGSGLSSIPQPPPRFT